MKEAFVIFQNQPFLQFKVNTRGLLHAICTDLFLINETNMHRCHGMLTM